MLWVQETFVNATRGYRFGESEPYETAYEDLGALYRSLRREYGGRVSRMYRDVAGGGHRQVGWVFSRRKRYEDCDEQYTREVWVEVFAREPVRTVTWDVEHPWAESA